MSNSNRRLLWFDIAKCWLQFQQIKLLCYLLQFSAHFRSLYKQRPSAGDSRAQTPLLRFVVWICCTTCRQQIQIQQIDVVNAVRSVSSENGSRQDCIKTKRPRKCYKKLSYRWGTARCVVSIEVLPVAKQQCRNYLYDKSWPNRWHEVGDLVGGNAW